jgi:hypothetical protein
MYSLSRRASLCALLLLSVIACSRSADQDAFQAELTWVEFATATIAEYYARNPESAVNAGLHEYDGQMRDMSLAANDDYVRWLRQKQDALQAYGDLRGADAFERDYLSAALASEVFDYETSGFIRNNPIFYAGHLGTSVYLDREYAPHGWPWRAGATAGGRRRSRRCCLCRRSLRRRCSPAGS